MHEDDPWVKNVITPEYSYIFNFEKSYSYVNTQKWLLNKLMYCYVGSVLYFIALIAGIRYMSERPKYNLKRLLALWCGLNALFSIIGFSRTAPELFFALGHRSFYYSVCMPSNYFQNSVSGFWMWALFLSKIVQLCDTIFIVLQKQQLTFLHIYRHLFIIPYFWLMYIETTAAMRWFSVIEYFIQSCIYSYYALIAMKFRVPVYFAFMITTMQLIQTVIGYLITIMASNQRDIYKVDCYMSYHSSIVGLSYYISSCYLYLKFFCSAHIPKVHGDKTVKFD